MDAEARRVRLSACSQRRSLPPEAACARRAPQPLPRSAPRPLPRFAGDHEWLRGQDDGV